MASATVYTPRNNGQFKFVVSGNLDSDFGKDKAQRSVMGYAAFLKGVPIMQKSGMQKCVTLLVTKAEMMATVTCIQDMVFIRNVLLSLRLKVQTPMILQCDNKGVVDLTNNWSVNG